MRSFPVVTATVIGIRGVERELLWSARNMGASEREILWQIALPAALPQIITGLQVALPIALIVGGRDRDADGRLRAGRRHDDGVALCRFARRVRRHRRDRGGRLSCWSRAWRSCAGACCCGTRRLWRRAPSNHKPVPTPSRSGRRDAGWPTSIGKLHRGQNSATDLQRGTNQGLSWLFLGLDWRLGRLLRQTERFQPCRLLPGGATRSFIFRHRLGSVPSLLLPFFCYRILSFFRLCHDSSFGLARDARGQTDLSTRGAYRNARTATGAPRRVTVMARHEAGRRSAEANCRAF